MEQKIAIEQISKKQSCHQPLAVSLCKLQPYLFPGISQSLLQRYDFAELYKGLAHTRLPDLLVSELPSALIGALVFEAQYLFSSGAFSRIGFYTQVLQNIRMACDGKDLSISEELEFITAFAELAKKIPDTMLRDLRSWENTAALCASIDVVKDEIEQKQRTRCMMPY